MRRWLMAVWMLWLAAPAWAQQTFNLAWDAGDRATGYVLEYGPAPGAVAQRFDVGPALTQALRRKVRP